MIGPRREGGVRTCTQKREELEQGVLCYPPLGTICGTMMRRERARELCRRLRAQPLNISFDDVVRLALLAGFEEVRTSGSHHIFRHRRYDHLLLNLQERAGEAKPYQVRQLVGLIAEYDLLGDGWPDFDTR